MKRLLTILCVALSCGAGAFAQAPVGRPPRYVALLADGRRIEGAALTDWHATGPAAAPKLDGHPLLDPNAPFRWLLDRTASESPAPSAYVETTGGDRLPGTTIGFVDGVGAYDAVGPHLIVRPEFSFSPPAPVVDPRIRVLAGYVRRIVWQRRTGPPLPPGSAALRDDRRLTFRAVRFTADGVHLLTDDGPKRLPFADLAELCLPVGDPWDPLFDELAALAPAGTGRLLQIETSDGCLCTASLQRLRCHAAGGAQDAARWLHGVQPAWSLDLLWFANAKIVARRSWAPEELPLTRVPPAAVRRSSLLAGGDADVRVNRNLAGRPLHSAGLDYGGGFAVQASARLEFLLPPSVRQFRSQVGLDRTVGAGGCVRARLFLGAADAPPAFDSGFLVGSSKSADTGPVALAPAPSAAPGSPVRLILDVDAAHDGRPPGADPLDIRDQADWLDPLLTFDPPSLRSELARRAVRLAPAWNGWTLPASDAALPADQRRSLEWSVAWNELASPGGGFTAGVAARQRPLILSRSIEVGPRDRWLVAAASLPAPTNPPVKIVVRIDGELAGEQALPVRNAGQRDPAPLAVSLEAYQGRTIEIQVEQQVSPLAPPDNSPAPVHWRTLNVFPQLPTLYQIFDEELDAALTSVGEGGEARVRTLEPAVASPPITGRRAIELTPPGRFRLDLPDRPAVRESPGWGEFRYVRLAIRKPGGGRFAVEFEGSEPRERPATIDGGVGPATSPGAVRIYQANLPDQWLTLPHDLFGSFGKFDLKSVVFSSPEGPPTLFDAVYLGRTLADFEAIGRDRAAPAPDQASLDQVAAGALMRVKPSLVDLEFPGGVRAVGVVITADGDVLAPAHRAGRAQQPVKVRLADGRLLDGRTLGVAREFDLALVKIAAGGPFPAVDVAWQPALPPERPCAALVPPLDGVAAGPPTAAPVMLRRLTREALWIDAPVERLAPGSPLCDGSGVVVGIASRMHAERGLFVRPSEITALLPRLRAGETIGLWPPRRSPDWGASLRLSPQGLETTRVAPDGPAARAGLKPGDRIAKVDGRPVADPLDVAERLAAADPGQELTFETTDGRTLRAVLAPSPW